MQELLSHINEKPNDQGHIQEGIDKWTLYAIRNYTGKRLAVALEVTKSLCAWIEFTARQDAGLEQD